MAKRTRVVADVKLKVYPIFLRAVEDGTYAGIRHAYKHAETTLSQAEEDRLAEQIVDDVMTELGDVIDFNLGGD